VRARGRGRSRAPHHVEQEAEELLGERAALDRQQQLHELGLLLVRLHDRVVEHALALRELLFARDRRRVDVARRRRRRVQQRRRRRRCRWCVFAVGGLERCCGAIVVRRIGGDHRVVACHETRVSATATEIHGVRECGAFDGGCAAACCNLSCRGPSESGRTPRLLRDQWMVADASGLWINECWRWGVSSRDPASEGGSAERVRVGAVRCEPGSQANGAPSRTPPSREAPHRPASTRTHKRDSERARLLIRFGQVDVHWMAGAIQGATGRSRAGT